VVLEVVQGQGHLVGRKGFDTIPQMDVRRVDTLCGNMETLTVKVLSRRWKKSYHGDGRDSTVMSILGFF